jgi:hypothetical protein
VTFAIVDGKISAKQRLKTFTLPQNWLSITCSNLAQEFVPVMGPNAK